MTATCFAWSTEELWPCIIVLVADYLVLDQGIGVHVDDKVVTPPPPNWSCAISYVMRYFRKYSGDPAQRAVEHSRG
jgi:hypothetical protein